MFSFSDLLDVFSQQKYKIPSCGVCSGGHGMAQNCSA